MVFFVRDKTLYLILQLYCRTYFIKVLKNKQKNKVKTESYPRQ